MSTNTKSGKPTANVTELYADERKKALDSKLKYYETEQNALDQSQKSQQQMASITLDKLQKYLPYQLKAQGLSNSGASESAMLQAHTNYMNTMSDIAANTNAEKTALERYKQQDIDAINEKYDAKEEAEYAANYEIAANNVMTKLENYVQSSEDKKISQAQADEITEYINGLTNVSDSDRARLMMLLDNGFEVRSVDEQNKINTAKTKLDNSADIVKLKGNVNTANEYEGDNFKVIVGDEEYKVEKGLLITDEETVNNLNNAYGGTPGTGSSVVYDGKLFMFLENSGREDSWCIVQGRSNDTSFRALCTALGITPYQRATTQQIAQASLDRLNTDVIAPTTDFVKQAGKNIKNATIDFVKQAGTNIKNATIERSKNSNKFVKEMLNKYAR